jgi:lysophospholipid acyltransferase (LPLAT)-like uncharacterized protein
MKKFFNHPLTVRVIAALISAYMYFVLVTSRVQVVTVVPAPLIAGPVVLASWHQQIPMLPVMNRPSSAKLFALVAASRAGLVVRRVATWFGIEAVEGSRRRGGLVGARTLIRAARSGHSLYITPDGSRGPARIAKGGATQIARLTRLPLIPCAAWPVRGKTFNTWDRFRLPFPFGTIRVAYGEPLELLTPAELGDALDTLTAHVQETTTNSEG